MSNFFDKKKIRIMIIIAIIILVIVLLLLNRSRKNQPGTSSLKPTIFSYDGGSQGGINQVKENKTQTGGGLFNIREILFGKKEPTPTKLPENNQTVSETNDSEVTDFQGNKSRLRYKDVRNNVVIWFDSIKNANGVYPYEESCNENGSCNIIEDNRAGLVAIWGRFKNYELTKDSNELAAITEDLNTYADKVDPIQNDFWNCRMMYELAKSPLLSSAAKEKAEAICKKGVPYLKTADEIEYKINDNAVLEVDFQKAISNEPIVVDQFMEKDKLYNYCSSASDFAYQYLWFNNGSDLKRSIYYFNLAIQAYQENKKAGKYLDEDWLLAIAGLDLFKATGNKNYHNYAMHIFQIKNNDTCATLFNCAAESMFYQEVFQLTKDIKYERYSRDIIGKIINFGYDDNGTKAYVLGKKAIRSFNQGAISYQTMENGLVLKLLAIVDQ